MKNFAFTLTMAVMFAMTLAPLPSQAVELQSGGTGGILEAIEMQGGALAIGNTGAEYTLVNAQLMPRTQWLPVAAAIGLGYQSSMGYGRLGMHARFGITPLPDGRLAAGGGVSAFFGHNGEHFAAYVSLWSVPRKSTLSPGKEWYPFIKAGVQHSAVRDDFFTEHRVFVQIGADLDINPARRSPLNF